MSFFFQNFSWHFTIVISQNIFYKIGFIVFYRSQWFTQFWWINFVNSCIGYRWQWRPIFSICVELWNLIDGLNVLSYVFIPNEFDCVSEELSSGNTETIWFVISQCFLLSLTTNLSFNVFCRENLVLYWNVFHHRCFKI